VGNLAERRPVTSLPGVRSGVVVDGVRAPEGADWQSPSAAVLPSADAVLSIDLGELYDVRALVLQADANDRYLVDYSLDGAVWSPMWLAPDVQEGHGLRTRFFVADRSVPLRQLRVRPVGGDGAFSVSELGAWCQLPEPWPPEVVVSPAPDMSGLTVPATDLIKALVAALGTLVLFWGFAVARAGRPETDQRARDVALAVLGVLAFVCWFNVGKFHFGTRIHYWDTYHYYVGGKYFPELGYTRLYECSALADIEDGLGAQVRARKMRDLATNTLHENQRRAQDPRSALADPSLCRSRFSDARWESFKHDVGWFRAKMGEQRWSESQMDHGFNATPGWALLGNLLANTGPATDRSVDLLVWVDTALLVAMWGLVWRAFGWRILCAGLVFWGTNFTAAYGWTGGSFLRQDWLAFTVASICLLRMGWLPAAGFALTWAALIRIFPGVIVLGPGLAVLMEMLRRRRFFLSRDHMRFAAGCIAALLILVPVSSAVSGGFRAWPDFLARSVVYYGTHATNTIGFPAILAYEHSTRAGATWDEALEEPGSVWKERREQVFGERRWIWMLATAAFVALVARAVAREEHWVAAVLGVALIPVASKIPNYYYSMLLVFVFLMPRRSWIGFSLCGLAALSGGAQVIWKWPDQIYGSLTFLTLIFCVTVTASLARKRPDFEPAPWSREGGGS